MIKLVMIINITKRNDSNEGDMQGNCKKLDYFYGLS